MVNNVLLNVAVFFTVLISQGLAFTHPPQDLALKDLYRALNYPPVLRGWNGSDPCEEYWTGITCSGSSIIHLKIQGLNLTGFLGSLLSDLNNLKQLDLSSNNIMGEIPFGLPRNVTHMNLSHNFLIGPIGDVFTGLDNLQEMDLSYNNFSGDLPSSFLFLKNLARLFLQNNRFNGSVTYLAELPLTDLNIQDNMFSGILPHHFLSIKNLRLGGNKFYEVGASPQWSFPLDTAANVHHSTPRLKVNGHMKKQLSPAGIALTVCGAGAIFMLTGLALMAYKYKNIFRLDGSLKLHRDGSGTFSASIAGYLKDGEGNVIAKFSDEERRVQKSTDVELSALASAFSTCVEQCEKVKDDGVTFIVDCEGVKKQANILLKDDWEATISPKYDHTLLAALRTSQVTLKELGVDFEIIWEERETNTESDKLCKEARPRKPPPTKQRRQSI